LTPSGFSSIWCAVIAGPLTAKWGYTDSEFSAYVLAPATTASTMQIHERGINMATKRVSSKSRGADAVSLLKADHRQVEQWFKQFESAHGQRKGTLARQICQALRVHTTIEEEIFYPAFLEQAQDEDLHHEAEVEHAGAKNLIAQIENGDPEDEYFDAKVSVLSEMIKHHVREEEQPGGMFAEAKKAKMNLKALGEELQARKKELEQSSKEGKVIAPSGARRARDSAVLTA